MGGEGAGLFVDDEDDSSVDCFWVEMGWDGRYRPELGSADDEGDMFLG